MIQHAAGQVDPVDDITPLIRATHLQQTAIAAVEFKEVIGLQDHVVEFEEGQRLFPIETGFDAFERQHPINAEMPPDVAQEFEVVQIVQPFGVVQHDRVTGTVTVGQVFLEHLLHAGDIGVDGGVVEQGAFIRPEGRVAHFGGAAAHQGDRFAAAFLQPAQHHDIHQMPHMKGFRCRVIADIGRHSPVHQRVIKALIVRTIGEKAALHHDADEIGFGVVCHGACPQLGWWCTL